MITAAMPVPLAWLVAAGLGEWRLGRTLVKRGRVLASLERVYAGRVLETREETPKGPLAREAVRDLFLRGAVFRGTCAETVRGLEDLGLAAQLQGSPMPPSLADWVLTRLEDLGLESGEDLPLLSPSDLLPDPLPPEVRERIDRDFPRRLNTGDAIYRVDYRVATREATLHQVKGTRKTPPAAMFLPRLPGWRISWEYKNRVRLVRDR
jgi:hypothetical protein